MIVLNKRETTPAAKMESPSKIPLQELSSNASPPSSASGEIFKRLSVSPNRNRKLLEKPAARLSPQQRVQTPKRLPSPDILGPNLSLDRYERQKSSVVKINEIVFPNSPTKASGALRNVPVLGGDGSLSRIRNRFKINNASPVKANLLDKLNKEKTETDTAKRKRKTDTPNAMKGSRVEKNERRTRSKSVMFKLPEDRIISIELNEMRKLNEALIARIEELEQRMARLEDRLP